MCITVHGVIAWKIMIFVPKLLCVYIARGSIQRMFVPDANHCASDSKVAATSLAVTALTV
jgi:hypothetical protein